MQTSRRILFLLWLCYVTTVFAIHVGAQTSDTGAIIGSVTDAHGKVVPGASVTVTNLGTNAKRTATAGAAGDFRVLLLPVGDYKIEATAPGFATFVVSPIAVRVSEKVTADAQLTVRAATETVTVTSRGEMVEHASSTLGAVVEPKTIVDLPLATRNFTQLLIFSPGVSTSVPDASALGLNSVELSSQGAFGADNNIEINGIDSNATFTNTLGSYGGVVGIAVPAPDSLEEFKVQTGQYDATTGRNGGASVAVVTKSGTNAFHGSMYEYFRNDDMDANSFFFNEQGLARPELKQNVFGGTFGGPIMRDKLFFFGSYQGMRQINGVSSGTTAFLPPLTNDRSQGTLGQIFAGQKGLQALGGIGPAILSDGSNISPTAVAILNYKLPNGQYLIPTPAMPTGPTILSAPAKFNEDQFNTNLDYQFSAGSRISGKYFDSRENTVAPFGFGELPGWGSTTPARNQNLSVSYLKIVNPRLINVARFGFTRLKSTLTSDEPLQASQLQMNLPSPLTDVPEIEIVGQFIFGGNYDGDVHATSNTYSFGDAVSYQAGRHSFQFGGEVKRLTNYAGTAITQHSLLLFLDFPSFLLGMNAAQNGFVLGDIYGNATFAGIFNRQLNATDYAGYAQDDLRLSSRLTLNLGLRYDVFGPLEDANGINSNFDFGLAIQVPPMGGTNSGYVVGKNAPGTIPSDATRWKNNSLLNSRNLTNFEPRFGFAYAFTKNLVVRGGYGIYYSHGSGEQAFQGVVSLPYGEINEQIPAINTTTTLQNPLPPLVPNSAFPIFVPRTAGSAQTVVATDPNKHDPYMQHFSLGVQYELARNFLVEVGYVGATGTHLLGNLGVNQPLLASPADPVHGITTNTIANAPLRVPYQGMASTSSEYTEPFTSSYNALEVSVTKRISHGIQFTSAYTYSRALDDLEQEFTGEGNELSLNGVAGNQANIALNRGPSSFDIANRFVTGAIWQLPKTTRAPGVARAFVNGWELTGVMILQSGPAFSVMDTGAGSIFGSTTSFAQFAPGMSAKNAKLSGSPESRLNEYFNTAAFGPAPAIGNGTDFGNSGRGILRAPGEHNLDFGLARHFALPKLGEASNLQFRAEAFNLTNTPDFAAPGSNRGTPSSFGVISGTTVNPRILQLALKVNF